MLCCWCACVCAVCLCAGACACVGFFTRSNPTHAPKQNTLTRMLHTPRRLFVRLLIPVHPSVDLSVGRSVGRQRRPGASGLAQCANPDLAAFVAQLLGMKPENDVSGLPLAELLVLKRRELPGGEFVDSPVDVEGAGFNRDALIKSLYEKIFVWLVQQVRSIVHLCVRAWRVRACVRCVCWVLTFLPVVVVVVVCE